MKTLRVSFDEEPDHEYVVRLSPVSLRDFGEVVDLIDPAITGSWPDSLRPLFERFTPLLVEWTHPEPITAEALEDRDPNVILAVVREWAKGVRSVPLPLPRASSGGEPSEAQRA